MNQNHISSNFLNYWFLQQGTCSDTGNNGPNLEKCENSGLKVVFHNHLMGSKCEVVGGVLCIVLFQFKNVNLPTLSLSILCE